MQFTAEQLLETMAEGVVVVDVEGRIRHWNAAMTELTGHGAQEALGQPMSWLRAPTCVNSARIAALLSRDRPVGLACVDGCECRLRSAAGEDIPVLVNARVLEDDAGATVGVLHTVVDFRPVESLRRQVSSLRELVRERDRFEGIIGASRPMQDVFRQIELAAASEATVLLTGESGTGKELAAAAIHNRGPRRHAPLVSVNCGALSETLLASELFGHVKGAFTGAMRDRVGRFEAAQGGTLFLDEIGDISLAMQVKLLRVLQSGEYERVGESDTRRADVRIIAATHRDLAEELAAGRFREDLYYRLRVFPLRMPPLRERREDLPLLVEHFVQLFTARTGRAIRTLHSEALRELMAHDWPGNVRELENALEYAFVVCRGDQILPEDLPAEVRERRNRAQGKVSVAATPRQRAGKALRCREELLALLDECEWNKAEVARRVHLSRTAVWQWMKRHGIPLQPPARRS